MLTLEYTLARHPVHPSSYANIRVHSMQGMPVHRVAMLTLEYTLARHASE